jgi:hypothetical protein
MEGGIMAGPRGTERTDGIWRGQHHALEEQIDEYVCPVCGIGLAQSNVDTPKRDYYCPFCATQQSPSVAPTA